jgi:hypothetical protein
MRTGDVRNVPYGVAMENVWSEELCAQLDWHWRAQLRPRLDGLTDDEYAWEPVPACWSIRPYDQVRTSKSSGSGPFRSEYERPDVPQPTPVTTIAWRIGHIITDCLLQRSAAHFGGEPFDRDTFAYAGTADEALALLDAAYDRWITGAAALGDRINEPCGPAEAPYDESPLGSLVLHINRELIHHGAEIALLRDLYLRLGRSS